MEVQEVGQGRLRRIYELLHQCDTSIHDLSRVDRFNMPFELGLACAMALSVAPKHHVVVFHSSERGLDAKFSDYRGHDVVGHLSRSDEIVGRLVDLFDRPGVPAAADLVKSAAILRKSVPHLKKAAQSSTLFRPAAFRSLIVTAGEIAKVGGYL